MNDFKHSKALLLLSCTIFCLVAALLVWKRVPVKSSLGKGCEAKSVVQTQCSPPQKAFTGLYALPNKMALSAIDKSGNSKEPLNSLQERLLELPLEVLRNAYEKKQNDLEQKLVKTRFIRPQTDQQVKDQREKLFDRLQDVVKQTQFWLASGSISIKGLSTPVTFLLNYYDSAHLNDGLSEMENLKDPRHLCWLLSVFVGDEPNQRWTTLSSCLEHLSKSGEDYYMVEMLAFDGAIAEVYSHLAVPAPLWRTEAQWELLSSVTGKWQKQESLDWSPISHSRSAEIQRQHRKEFSYP